MKSKDDDAKQTKSYLLRNREGEAVYNFSFLTFFLGTKQIMNGSEYEIFPKVMSQFSHMRPGRPSRSLKEPMLTSVEATKWKKVKTNNTTNNKVDSLTISSNKNNKIKKIKNGKGNLTSINTVDEEDFKRVLENDYSVLSCVCARLHYLNMFLLHCQFSHPWKESEILFRNQNNCFGDQTKNK